MAAEPPDTNRLIAQLERTIDDRDSAYIRQGRRFFHQMGSLWLAVGGAIMAFTPAGGPPLLGGILGGIMSGIGTLSITHSAFEYGGIVPVWRARRARAKAIRNALQAGEFIDAQRLQSAGWKLDRFPRHAEARFERRLAAAKPRAAAAPAAAPTPVVHSDAPKQAEPVAVPFEPRHSPVVHSDAPKQAEPVVVPFGPEHSPDGWVTMTMRAMSESPAACIAGVAAMQEALHNSRRDVLRDARRKQPPFEGERRRPVAEAIARHAEQIEQTIVEVMERSSGPQRAMARDAAALLTEVAYDSCRLLQTYFHRHRYVDPETERHLRASESHYRSQAARWAERIPGASSTRGRAAS